MLHTTQLKLRARSLLQESKHEKTTLDQRGSSGSGKRWADSEYILNVKPVVVGSGM